MGRYFLSAGFGLTFGLASSSLALQGSAGDPAKALRTAAATELKVFKAAVQAGLDFYGAQFDSLGDSVASSTIGLDLAVPEVVQFANGALVGLRTAADGAARSLETFAATQATTSPLFPGSLIGDFGGLDRFQSGLDAEVVKAKVKLARLLQGFKKQVGSSTEFAVNAALADMVEVAPPAPNPGVSVPLPLRELKIYALAAGSDASVSNDGILAAGGEGDLANGPVTVTLTGPSGFSEVHNNVAINPATGRWQTTFPATLPRNLAEGNYRVEVFQGAGASVNAAIGIPGAP